MKNLIKTDIIRIEKEGNIRGVIMKIIGIDDQEEKRKEVNSNNSSYSFYYNINHSYSIWFLYRK